MTQINASTQTRALGGTSLGTANTASQAFPSVEGLFGGQTGLLAQLPRATRVWQPRSSTESAAQFCRNQGAAGTSPNHTVPPMGPEGRYLWCK